MSTPFANQPQRTAALTSLLDQEHFRFRRAPEATVAEGEVELVAAWATSLSAPQTSLTDQMLADFREFCATCLGVSLSDTSAPQPGQPEIRWRLTGPAFPTPIDPQDPAIEAFEIEATPHSVEIRARHERGLLHGTHYLEWLMADRGGPFLPLGKIERQPAFMPRLSNGVFITAQQTPQSPGHFSDAYLSLMSHYGVNGIHFYLDLWHLFRCTTLPELNSSGFEEQIAALRELNARTLRHGIDLYLHLNTPPLPASHAVFAAHPETRGGAVAIFGDKRGEEWKHNLCSGSSEALAAYAEAIESIYSAAPELAGAMMIVGGECFFHCFTRPADSGNGETNCPHCRGKSASSEVARLTNTLAQAIKRTGAHKSFYAWPYSAFIWSAHDPAEIDWIAQLDPEVSVLSNFDCGDSDAATGSGAHFFDYNIKCIGPSTTFARQAQKLHAMEPPRPIFTKIESNTTPDAFFLPYLPLHYRWLARYRAMRETGVAGLVGQWRFYGMNASLPEELQYKMTWRPSDSESKNVNESEDLLATICRRDFALNAEATCDVLAGWKALSEAWEHFPYSGMTSGERAAYMRGPLYLGTAHPLIFDVQETYQLPIEFRILRGDAGESLGTPEEMEEMQRSAKPRYISDLLITLPFGVGPYLQWIGRCRTKWTEGMNLLRKHLAEGNESARRELGVCETIDSHLRTIENVVRFYQGRDLLQNEACTREEFNLRLAALQEILGDEMANAERMLPILESDPRLGYGHCYGPVYDAAMVRAKIEQCRYVKEVELPSFSQIVRFHVWLDAP